MDTKKLLIIAGTLAFVMAAAALAIVVSTSQEDQPTPLTTRYTGTQTCLPKKNVQPGEPQTLECAIGIKTIDGKYYGLKDMPVESQNVEFATSITVTGDLEQPAADEKYDIAGTIKVKTFQVNNVTDN